MQPGPKKMIIIMHFYFAVLSGEWFPVNYNIIIAYSARPTGRSPWRGLCTGRGPQVVIIVVDCGLLRSLMHDGYLLTFAIPHTHRAVCFRVMIVVCLILVFPMQYL